MVNVDVHKYPEHAGENLLAGRLEVAREVDVGVPGKDGLVEDLALDPLKQTVHVLGRGQRGGLLKVKTEWNTKIGC
jgi:hypothetical protein